MQEDSAPLQTSSVPNANCLEQQEFGAVRRQSNMNIPNFRLLWDARRDQIQGLASKRALCLEHSRGEHRRGPREGDVSPDTG